MHEMQTIQFDRRALNDLVLQPLHRARNWSKADVSLTEWPPHSGRRVVVKDLLKRPLWYRLAYGRHTLTREWNAMLALSDVEGVLLAVARPDADCLITEFFDGTPLKNFAADALQSATVARIENIMAAAHAHGVTHGDLHRSNVLIATDGSVAVIDWASACVFGEHRPLWKARTFSELCALDRRSVAKIKKRYAPELVSAEEQEMLERGSSSLYRFVKSFRHVLDWARGRRKKKLPDNVKTAPK
jgi:RIO-like serine/threonine protein kinase